MEKFIKPPKIIIIVPGMIEWEVFGNIQENTRLQGKVKNIAKTPTNASFL